MILTNADIGTRVMFRATLADKDVSCLCKLTSEDLNSQSFAF